MTLETRRASAAAAFAHTAAYDAAVAGWFAQQDGGDALPGFVGLAYEKVGDLRYGENPHQRGALYAEAGGAGRARWRGGAAGQGDVVQQLARRRRRLRAGLGAAGERRGDRQAQQPVRGGVGVHARRRRTRRRSPATRSRRSAASSRSTRRATGRPPPRWPTCSPRSSSHRRSPTRRWPRSRRGRTCVSCGRRSRPAPGSTSVRSPAARSSRTGTWSPSRRRPAEDWKVVSAREPTEQEWRDLAFAWTVAWRVKSNAIVFAKDGATVGVGAGQMSRVDAAWIAVRKAEGRAEGAVMASDAFFPFPDAIEVAADAGVHGGRASRRVQARRRHARRGRGAGDGRGDHGSAPLPSLRLGRR